MIHSKYLEEALHPEKRKLIINQLVTTIRKSGIEFDSIAFTGTSGALIAPFVAARLHKGLILVRKPYDNSHTTMMVEGEDRGTTYIILDDQVSSGATVNRIVETIQSEPVFSELQPKALFLYASIEYSAITSRMAEVLGEKHHITVYDKKVKLYDPEDVR